MLSSFSELVCVTDFVVTVDQNFEEELWVKIQLSEIILDARIANVKNTTRKWNQLWELKSHVLNFFNYNNKDNRTRSAEREGGHFQKNWPLRTETDLSEDS